ncbi:MAG: dihydrolipoyl dehydrogenase [Bacteroides sp.]|nr:dihydrolipoyl dehydrogenase [Bacteroides sp.]
MKYQIAIIGGGPAGYTAAEAAGRAGKSVVLFEKQNLGGVCLNEGCIPTKTLLYSAKTLDSARHAGKYAVRVEGVPTADLPKVIARKQKVVRKLVLGVKGKLTAHGVTIVSGEATVADRNRVQCNGETYECDNLLLCTGSETFIPPIPGVESVPYWTHREALDCKQLPESLAIIGGGVIGMEFASFFCSMGVQVTVVEMMDEILGGMDKELSALLRADYAKRGVKFLLKTRVTSLERALPATETDAETAAEAVADAPAEAIRVNYVDAEGHEDSVVAEKLLMSVGRRPVQHGAGLENLPLQRTERGHIRVDEHMQTSLPGVYACGDLTGFSLLAHTAVREAEVAVNHILGRTDAMSYRAIPGVVYTNPEIAGVGETEESLQRKGIAYRVSKLPMAYSGRFVAENEGVNGVCKLLLAEDDTLLGAHLLGNPASEIVTLAGMAIELRLPARQWSRTVFPHPTVGEIFKEALETREIIK